HVPAPGPGRGVRVSRSDLDVRLRQVRLARIRGRVEGVLLLDDHARDAELLSALTIGTRSFELKSAPVKIRVLSYNIHKAIGVDGRFAPARIIEVLKHHEADVVLLQEVDRHAGRSNHIDLASAIASALTYPYRAVGMNVFKKAGKYG